MFDRWTRAGVAGMLAGGLTGVAAAGEPAEEKLREKVQSLEKQVAELRAKQESSWLNKKRAEQVKTLVRDVLKDADTRASLQGEGMTGGWKDGDFFLASRDRRFYIEFDGHLQVRYTFNQRSDSGGDDNLGGFNLRRAKFKPEGWIMAGDQKIKFDISLAGDQDAGASPIFEDYYFEVPFSDRFAVRAGRWKQPFALQNTTSSSRQLAVERSAVHELFNVDRSEGAMLTYSGDMFRLYGAVNDGRDAQKTDFNQDSTDVAFTGRAEAALAGKWDQLDDPATAWEGEPLGVFLGSALHYEEAETGRSNLVTDDVDGNGAIGAGEAIDPNNFFLWTTDLTVEAGGWGALLAGYGHHAENDTGGNYDDYGLLVESGYFVIPDTLQPFVRYEAIFADDARALVSRGGLDETTNLVTAGVNWYQSKHDAKFTLDFVYAFSSLVSSPLGPGAEPDDIASSSLGLREDAAGEDGQFAVRAQYQIKF